MVISEKKIKRNIRSISSEVLNGENYGGFYQFHFLFLA